MGLWWVVGCGLGFTPEPVVHPVDPEPVDPEPVAPAPDPAPVDGPAPPVPVVVEGSKRLAEERTRLEQAQCHGESDCAETARDVFVLHYIEATLEAARARQGAGGELVPCDGPLEPCLTNAFGAGHGLYLETGVLWVVPGEGDEGSREPAQRILLRGAAEGWLAPDATVQELRILRRDSIDDRLLVRAVGQVSDGPMRGEGGDFERTGDLVWPADVLEEGAPDKIVRWPARLWQPLVAVCATEMVQVSDDDLRVVRVTDQTLLGGLGVQFEYATSCRPLLLLRHDAITPGPRPPSSRGSADAADAAQTFQTEGASRGGSTACRITAGTQVLEENARGCALVFVGDLNRDGVDDAVIHTFGEMGCDGRTLWLSEVGGPWVAAAGTANPC